MSDARANIGNPVIVGRSSSHFTRVVRIFAAELGVDYSFQVVRDLMSNDPADYAGNPALKLPALRTGDAIWFGALNICRELARQSRAPARITWPEQLHQPLLANAQELIVQGMSTEVALIMSNAAASEPGAHQLKMKNSLLGTLSWLEDNIQAALASLPPRDLSYLEVTLFCFMTHLEFRKVLPTSTYKNLNEFCELFASRNSCQATHYHFDS